MKTEQEIKNTMLIEAVELGNVKRISGLIQMGADPNTTKIFTEFDSYNHKTKKIPQQVKSVLMLAMEKLNPYVSAHHIDTFNNASLYDVVHILLKAGANPNSKNENGNTPLHLASALNRTEIVSLLISFGADKNTINKAKKTPLDLATSVTMKKILNDESDLRRKVEDQLLKVMSES